MQESKKTSSGANTLKGWKNHIDRTHRGISSCRPDDVYPLPKSNVLLPFGILIIANFSLIVNIFSTKIADLYTCTIPDFKIVYFAQFYSSEVIFSSSLSLSSFFLRLLSTYLLPKMMPTSEMIAVIAKTIMANK